MRFSWQQGYGAFTVSPCQKILLCNYINRQKEHHKTISFANEFRDLLRENHVTYDENIAKTDYLSHPSRGLGGWGA